MSWRIFFFDLLDCVVLCFLRLFASMVVYWFGFWLHWMTRNASLDKDFIKVDVIVFKLIVSACVLDRLFLFFCWKD